MSEINVTARTQRIIVDPYSASVSVINAGPQGPAGPQGIPGLISLEEVRDDLASVLVPGANVTIVPNDANNTITISATGGDGLSGGYNYVQDETDPPLTPSLGETWFAPDTGNTYLRYDNGVSIVWLKSAAAVVAGGYNYVQDETNPPASPIVGETWFAPNTGHTYLRYDDGVSTVWMQTAEANGGSGGGGLLTAIDGGNASTIF